jgi:hypothetical protein
MATTRDAEAMRRGQLADRDGVMMRQTFVVAGVLSGVLAGSAPADPGREPPPPPVGDLTGDYRVDFDDVVTLLWSWGPCEWPPCAADLDGDDFIEWIDLMILLSLLDTVPTIA